jgi:hypothetical protein
MYQLLRERPQELDYQAQIEVLWLNSIRENGLRTQLLFSQDLCSLCAPSLNLKIKLLPLLVIETWPFLSILYFFANSWGIVMAIDVDPIFITLRSGYFNKTIFI